MGDSKRNMSRQITLSMIMRRRHRCRVTSLCSARLRTATSQGPEDAAPLWCACVRQRMWTPALVTFSILSLPI